MAVYQEEVIKVDVEKPVLYSKRNRVKLTSKEHEIYYSVNNSEYKKYEKEIAIDTIGEHKISFYSRRKMQDKFIDYYDSDVVEEKIYVKEIQKDFYSYETELEIEENSIIMQKGKYIFIIEKYGVIKVTVDMNEVTDINKLSMKNLKYDYLIKNAYFSGNNLVLLIYDYKENISRIVETSIELEIISNKSIDISDYDKIRNDNKYYYVANKEGIKKIEKKTNLITEIKNLKEFELVNINEVKVDNNIYLYGNKTNIYNTIEPYEIVIRSNNNTSIKIFKEEGNESKNEFYIAKIGDEIITLEDRKRIKIRNDNKIVYSKELKDISVINNVNIKEDEIIIIGNNLNKTSMFIISIKRNERYKSIEYYYTSEFVPLNVTKNDDEYRIDGSQKRKYKSIIINENQLR